MKNKTIISVVLILAFIGVIYFIRLERKQNSPQDQSDSSASTTPSNTDASTQSTSTSPVPTVAAPSAVKIPANDLTPKNLSHIVTIKTNMGDISFETFDADAPNTVKNFVTLTNKGFYDGLIFHRVIPGFMIQGGDPLGTGVGGPGYAFDDELNPSTDSYKTGYQKGVVAMANAGPNTNGSQFFIMVDNYPLPYNYTIFGKVVAGQDVADAISNVAADQSNNRPISNVTMQKVTVTNNTDAK
ncbi:MAG: peptidylprolyl isomerase [Candidatus Vogelbacteria bacterium]|nr:peptidylprolyl isomerase [Candidatus Vogelbacteria bacterium]